MSSKSKQDTSIDEVEETDQDSDIVDVDFEELDVLEPEIIEAEPSPEPASKSKATKNQAKAEDKALSPADPVAKYLAEIRKYELLTPEQEKALAIQYYEYGDKEAAERLVTSNLRFVVKIAAEYAKFGSRMIDLIQEGNVGLMHAVKEFNPYKGVKLITYAVWWIRGYIQDYLMKQYSMVKIGTTAQQRKLFYQLQRQKEELDRLGPSTVIKQLSGKFDIDEDQVTQVAQRVIGRDVSLNQPLDDSDRTTLQDLQTSPTEELADDQLVNLELIELLNRNIEAIKPQLNKREVEILEKRLLNPEPATLQEIADVHGVSREAVRQMENRVLKKIKAALFEDLDDELKPD